MGRLKFDFHTAAGGARAEEVLEEAAGGIRLEEALSLKWGTALDFANAALDAGG